MIKFKKKQFATIGCLVICISCLHLEKPNDYFNKVLNSSEIVSGQRLKLNGAFHNNMEDGDYLERPIFFFENGLVYIDNVSIVKETDEKIHFDWLRRNLVDRKTWGVFEIIGDTVKVCTYYPYYGGTAHFLLTNFQGIVKNTDTITDWHMVAPFPKLNKSLTKMYDFLIKEHRTLYFKHLSFEPFMDSVSKAAWINKYRTKK